MEQWLDYLLKKTLSTGDCHDDYDDDLLCYIDNTWIIIITQMMTPAMASVSLCAINFSKNSSIFATTSISISTNNILSRCKNKVFATKMIKMWIEYLCYSRHCDWWSLPNALPLTLRKTFINIWIWLIYHVLLTHANLQLWKCSWVTRWFSYEVVVGSIPSRSMNKYSIIGIMSEGKYKAAFVHKSDKSHHKRPHQGLISNDWMTVCEYRLTDW